MCCANARDGAVAEDQEAERGAGSGLPQAGPAGLGQDQRLADDVERLRGEQRGEGDFEKHYASYGPLAGDLEGTR